MPDAPEGPAPNGAAPDDAPPVRALDRPNVPLPHRPAGYQQMESYSSLRRFWAMLDAAARAGRTVRPPRGDSELTCRRRIEGYAVPGAGGLLDVQRALDSLEEGLVPHPALLALLAGDPDPLRALLSAEYELRASFVLAFTRSRDLILKPELKYAPLAGEPLPRDLTLAPRRFSRDELRFLLERAVGLAG